MDFSIFFGYRLVMIGLRTFLKDFASTTKLAPFDTLYERQRELVRCGLLPSVGGRGPGSGVPLSAETLATFLIGVLATDKLADLGERTELLCKARPVINDQKGGYRIGNSNFHMDVARALLQQRKTGERSPKDVYLGIQVTRPWRGIILLDRGTATQGAASVEYFAAPEEEIDLTFTFENISIEGVVFSWISQRLWDYMEHYPGFEKRSDQDQAMVPLRTAALRSSGSGVISPGSVVNLVDTLKKRIQRDAAAKKRADKSSKSGARIPKSSK